MGATYCIAGLGITISLASLYYFKRKYKNEKTNFQFNLPILNG